MFVKIILCTYFEDYYSAYTLRKLLFSCLVGGSSKYEKEKKKEAAELKKFKAVLKISLLVGYICGDCSNIVK